MGVGVGVGIGVNVDGIMVSAGGIVGTGGMGRKGISMESLVEASEEGSQNTGEHGEQRRTSRPSLLKPSLFQAVVSTVSSSNSSSSSSSIDDHTPRNQSKQQSEEYEWQALGVYDDDDLVDTSVLLLLCPGGRHFLWVGNRFDFHLENGLSGTIEDMKLHDGESTMLLKQWAASIHPGELKGQGADNVVCSSLLGSNTEVNLSGNETDLFWDIFNEGF